MRSVITSLIGYCLTLLGVAFQSPHLVIGGAIICLFEQVLQLFSE